MQIAVQVLVVEDEPMIRMTLQDALEDAGYAVMWASDGHEAMRLLEERGKELNGLITDVKLGDSPDGWHVARHAREISPDLPVV
jgi:DNA-binding response OmpR family regulator